MRKREYVFSTLEDARDHHPDPTDDRWRLHEVVHDDRKRKVYVWERDAIRAQGLSAKYFGFTYGFVERLREPSDIVAECKEMPPDQREIVADELLCDVEPDALRRILRRLEKRLGKADGKAAL